MTDIVERLRVHEWYDGSEIDLVQEAVDTIETLRAAVKAENEACAKIADSWSSDAQRQFGNGGPAAAIRARMEAKP